MRNYLKAFFESFEYPCEAVRTLLAAYDAVERNEAAAEKFSAALGRYHADMNCNFRELLEEARQASEQAGIHEYTGKFLLCACMSHRLKEYYAQAGLDGALWRAAMSDLSYKLTECHLVYGIWGSFVCAWFDRFFNITRFALGRLQFELIPFGRCCEKGGVRLNAESTVINVHIPRTGGRMPYEEVKDAYARAAAFFKERYGLKEIVFSCHSWLLYPKNTQVLNEGANLRRFISDYEMIEWKPYRDYSEVWRLFDMNFAGDADALPQDSSLRRAYADWIRGGIPTGWGHGVYVYEG